MAGETIDPLITAFIQLQIAPDAVKQIETTINQLVKSLEKIKAVKLDLSLSEGSQASIARIESLARSLQGIAGSGGNAFRGLAQAARAAAQAQKITASAQDQYGKAFAAQFSGVEKRLARQLASAEFLLGVRSTPAVTNNDLLVMRQINAERTFNDSQAAAARKASSAALRNEAKEAKQLSREAEKYQAFLTKAFRLQEVSFAKQEAKELKQLQKEAEKYEQFWLKAMRQQEVSAAKEEAKEVARLNKEAERYTAFWEKSTRLQDIAARKLKEAVAQQELLARFDRRSIALAQRFANRRVLRGTRESNVIQERDLRLAERFYARQDAAASQESARAAKAKQDRERYLALLNQESLAVQRESKRLAETAFGLGARDSKDVLPQDIANAQIRVSQAERQKKVAKETEEIEKRRVSQEKKALELLKQSVSADTIRLARRKVLAEIKSGRRSDAEINAEDIRLADIVIGKRQRETESLRRQAEAEEALKLRAKARLQAQLDSQDAAFRRQAQAFARAAFVQGRRPDEAITQTDIDNTQLLRELDQQRAAAAEDLEQQQKLVSDQLRVQNELLLAQYSTQAKQVAQLRAKREFSAGKRTNQDLTQRDLDIGERVARARQSATERQAEADRRVADQREALLRRFSTEERRIAQRIADRQFNSGQRPRPIFDQADLQRARKIKERFDLAVEGSKKLKERIESDSKRAEQALNRVSKAAGNLGSKLTGAFTGTTMDVGFLFPQAQFLGNITRIGLAWGKAGAALGEYGAAQFDLGRTGSRVLQGLGGLVGAFSGGLVGIFGKLASVTLNLGVALGRLAFAPIAAGLRLLLAPTLAVVRGFQRLVAYGPAIATALGIGLAKSLTDAAVQMERLRSLFDAAFLGDADTRFDALAKRADQMGISFEQAAQPMARLAFAARSAGIEADGLDSLFQGVSSAAVALKLDSERLNRAFTAFEQILSKGRVSSEELRGQLAEAIPGIVPIVQRALRLTDRELDELLEKGQLTSKELILALGPELSRAFQSGAAANANSLAAQVARIDNQFLRLRATIGAAIAPAFLRLKKALLDLASSDRVIRFLTAVANRFAQLLDLLRTSPAIQKFGQLLADVFLRLGPIIESIIRKLLTIQVVVNGTILGAFVRLAESALPAIERALERVLAKIRQITGLGIFNVEDSLSFVSILASQADSLKNLYLAVFDYLLFEAKMAAYAFLNIGLGVATALAAGIKDQLTGVLEEALWGTGKRSQLKDVEQNIKNQTEALAVLQEKLANPELREVPGVGPGEPSTFLSEETIKRQIAEFEAAIEDGKKKRKVLVEEIVKDEANNFKDAYAKYAPLVTDAFTSPAEHELNSRLRKQNQDAIRKELEPLQQAFESAKFENNLNGWVQGLKSAAEKAVDAVSPITDLADGIGTSLNRGFGPFANAFGNAITGLLGPLGNLVGGRAPSFREQAKGASNAFIDFGQKFFSEAVKGGKPFAALGPLFGSLAKLGKTLPNIPNAPGRNDQLQQEAETFRSQFLDAESLFQNMQAQEQVKEQKKTNEELAMLRQEVKRGNDLAAARIPGGMGLDIRMRGAIA